MEPVRVAILCGAVVFGVGAAIAVNNCSNTNDRLKNMESGGRTPTRAIVEVCQDNTQVYKVGEEFFVASTDSSHVCGTEMTKLAMTPQMFCAPRGGTAAKPLNTESEDVYYGDDAPSESETEQ